MAIQIRAHLTATPNPTTLPRRIDFHQTLRSNLASEDVVAVYQLRSEIDVWFQDGNGNPTKTVQRDLTVTQADQAFLVRIVLQTRSESQADRRWWRLTRCSPTPRGSRFRTASCSGSAEQDGAAI